MAALRQDPQNSQSSQGSQGGSAILGLHPLAGNQAVASRLSEMLTERLTTVLGTAQTASARIVAHREQSRQTIDRATRVAVAANQATRTGAQARITGQLADTRQSTSAIGELQVTRAAGVADDQHPAGQSAGPGEPDQLLARAQASVSAGITEPARTRQRLAGQQLAAGIRSHVEVTNRSLAQEVTSCSAELAALTELGEQAVLAVAPLARQQIDRRAAAALSTIDTVATEAAADLLALAQVDRSEVSVDQLTDAATVTTESAVQAIGGTTTSATGQLRQLAERVGQHTGTGSEQFHTATAQAGDAVDTHLATRTQQLAGSLTAVVDQAADAQRQFTARTEQERAAATREVTLAYAGRSGHRAAGPTDPATIGPVDPAALQGSPPVQHDPSVQGSPSLQLSPAIQLSPSVQRAAEPARPAAESTSWWGRQFDRFRAWLAAATELAAGSAVRQAAVVLAQVAIGSLVVGLVAAGGWALLGALVGAGVLATGTAVTIGTASGLALLAGTMFAAGWAGIERRFAEARQDALVLDHDADPRFTGLERTILVTFGLLDLTPFLRLTEAVIGTRATGGTLTEDERWSAVGYLGAWLGAARLSRAIGQLVLRTAGRATRGLAHWYRHRGQHPPTRPPRGPGPTPVGPAPTGPTPAGQLLSPTNQPSTTFAPWVSPWGQVTRTGLAGPAGPTADDDVAPMALRHYNGTHPPATSPAAGPDQTPGQPTGTGLLGRLEASQAGGVTGADEIHPAESSGELVRSDDLLADSTELDAPGSVPLSQPLLNPKALHEALSWNQSFGKLNREQLFKVQRILGVPATGGLTEETVQATAEFQHKRAMPTTGRLDAPTLARLTTLGLYSPTAVREYANLVTWDLREWDQFPLPERLYRMAYLIDDRLQRDRILTPTWEIVHVDPGVDRVGLLPLEWNVQVPAYLLTTRRLTRADAEHLATWFYRIGRQVQITYHGAWASLEQLRASGRPVEPPGGSEDDYRHLASQLGVAPRVARDLVEFSSENLRPAPLAGYGDVNRPLRRIAPPVDDLPIRLPKLADPGPRAGSAAAPSPSAASDRALPSGLIPEDARPMRPAEPDRPLITRLQEFDAAGLTPQEPAGPGFTRMLEASEGNLIWLVTRESGLQVLPGYLPGVPRPSLDAMAMVGQWRQAGRPPLPHRVELLAAGTARFVMRDGTWHPVGIDNVTPHFEGDRVDVAAIGIPAWAGYGITFEARGADATGNAVDTWHRGGLGHSANHFRRVVTATGEGWRCQITTTRIDGLASWHEGTSSLQGTWSPGTGTMEIQAIDLADTGTHLVVRTGRGPLLDPVTAGLLDAAWDLAAKAGPVRRLRFDAVTDRDTLESWAALPESIVSTNPQFPQPALVEALRPWLVWHGVNPRSITVEPVDLRDRSAYQHERDAVTIVIELDQQPDEAPDTQRTNSQEPSTPRSAVSPEVSISTRGTPEPESATSEPSPDTAPGGPASVPSGPTTIPDPAPPTQEDELEGPPTRPSN